MATARVLLAGDDPQSDGYFVVAQKLAECMRKMDERFDNLDDVAHQGRLVCEYAASFFKAVRTSQSPLEGRRTLQKELNELAILKRPDWAKDVDVLETTPLWRLDGLNEASALMNAMDLLRKSGNVLGAHREDRAAPTIQSYGRTEIADATYAVASAVCNEFEEIGTNQAVKEGSRAPWSDTDDHAFPNELGCIKEGAQRALAADPLASISNEVASMWISVLKLLTHARDAAA